MNKEFKEKLRKYLDESNNLQKQGELDVFKYLNEIFYMMFNEISPNDQEAYIYQVSFTDIVANEIEKIEEGI